MTYDRPLEHKDNLLVNPLAEIGTTAWVVYDDGAVDAPVDGTGGTATEITLTASTANVIMGGRSFRVTKSSSDAQGEGISTDFSIPDTFKNQVLNINFEYISGSGYADTDLKLFIYDIDNTQLIYVDESEIKDVGTYGNGKHLATFQATNSSNYRLIFHLPNTTTTGWTFTFDNVKVTRNFENETRQDAFALKGINGVIAYINGGSIFLSDGYIISTANQTSSLRDILIGRYNDTPINLNSVLITAKANDTLYHLYVDREQLSEATLSDSDLKVYRVYDNSHFKLLTTPPDQVNQYRYIHIGWIKTPSSGTDWAGKDGYFGSTPVRTHNPNVINTTERYTTQITTATTTTYAHGLSGEPHHVQFYYYDGSKVAGQPIANHLVDKNGTNLEINSNGLTFGSGEYLEVQATYIPKLGSLLLSSTTQFESQWFQNTSTTTVAHNLTEMDDIASYTVIEWDVTNDKRRVVQPSSLVQNFDDTNFYLNWGSLTPSATLQYKVIAGGTALPGAVNERVGGFTKWVGFGPGSYSTLAAALTASAAGDHILINKGYSISATETISISDICVTFMPGVTITIGSGATAGLTITGDRVRVYRPDYEANFSGTLTDIINVSGDDCSVLESRVIANNSGLTVTNAYNISGGNRNYINGTSEAVSGTITNVIVDSGTDSDYTVRG